MDKNLYHFSIRSIFESIGEQVENNLFIFIDIHPQIKFRLFRKIQNKKMKMQVQRVNVVAFTRKIMENFDSVAEEHHIDFLFETEVEYLIDETQHTICVALHNL